jgi:osmotically-inducible protein OsmY
MNKLYLVLVLINCLLLNACSTLIVGGAATGVAASQDRRSIKTQLADEKTELKALKALFNNDELWKDCNIKVISYNSLILIVGQAPTLTLKEKANQEILKIAKVSKVHNQIKVAAPVSFFASRNDDFLTTKVKSSMLFTKAFPSMKIKVITENSEVYLMGLVTKKEADKAVEIARNISGVKRVVKVFEYIETNKK